MAAGPARPGQGVLRDGAAARKRDRASIHAGIRLHPRRRPITGMKAISQPTLPVSNAAWRSPMSMGYPMYGVIGPLWATSALAARGPAPKVLEKLCGLLGKLPAENRCIQMPLYRILLADRIRTDRTDRAGAEFRGLGGVAGGADRRELGLRPRSTGFTARCCVANRRGTTGAPCACSSARWLRQEDRGGRLEIAHGDQHRASGRERIRPRRSTGPADVDPGEIRIR